MLGIIQLNWVTLTDLGILCEHAHLEGFLGLEGSSWEHPINFSILRDRMASKMVCRELVPFEGPSFCPVPSSSTIHRSSKMNTSSPSTSILLKRRTVQQVQVHSSPSRLTNFGSLTPHRSASQEHLPSSPLRIPELLTCAAGGRCFTDPAIVTGAHETTSSGIPTVQRATRGGWPLGFFKKGTWVAVGGDKQDSTSRLGLIWGYFDKHRGRTSSTRTLVHTSPDVPVIFKYAPHSNFKTCLSVYIIV